MDHAVHGFWAVQLRATVHPRPAQPKPANPQLAGTLLLKWHFHPDHWGQGLRHRGQTDQYYNAVCELYEGLNSSS
ncbi:hypothetical protein QF031_000389 [Pseudarthrobacter defluvii]|uniref:hypothetical protein n=1 Tax=Pseudarthrobacter defluvii TaxID=410837 RepID=UPI0027854F8F|nr:hypothetical protein [Pseudarthrobacter defluvii]MDQ0767640.1 hypothetical protein [Pseudarthrobacter defluvii]